MTDHADIDHSGLTGVGTGPSGTSFPGSPSTNDRFYRTDLDLEFFYDGTRWLSTELFVRDFTTMEFISATSSGNRRACTKPLGSDIWLEKYETRFYVNAGGTALGASHKWVGVVRKNAASATVIATINIDSGASDVYRELSAAIDALQNAGTVQYVFDMSWTKTGTPGTLLVASYLTYRHVAT